MNDNEFKKLIGKINTQVTPPSGMKDKILNNIFEMEGPALTGVERLIFERPLRAACALSVFVSSVLWAVMGSGFTGILSGLVRQR